MQAHPDQRALRVLTDCGLEYIGSETRGGMVFWTLQNAQGDVIHVNPCEVDVETGRLSRRLSAWLAQETNGR